jgi:hypothetical protein
LPAGRVAAQTMVSRFLTNLVLLLASAFAIVATFALSRATGAWILLGLGCTTVFLSLCGFGLRERGALQRGLDLLAATAGAFLIVASRGFAPGTSRWIGFGVAAGLLGLSVTGLLGREILLRPHALPRPAR